MLLALYQATAAEHRMTSTNMCDVSQAPATTALRWIENLVQLGMVTRREHPLDRRIIYIEMTPDTFSDISDYLMEIYVRTYSSE